MTNPHHCGLVDGTSGIQTFLAGRNLILNAMLPPTAPSATKSEMAARAALRLGDHSRLRKRREALREVVSNG